MQDRINEKIKIAFPGLKLQIQVQRINAMMVSGRDIILESEEFNLERILQQDIPQCSSLAETESASKAEPETPKITAE